MLLAARRSTQRTLVGLVGIAATVLLHSLLFMAAVWDGGRLLHPKWPDATGAGANVGQQDGEPGERRVMVMLEPVPALPASPPPAPQLAEPIIQQPSVLEITGPDPLPLPPLEAQSGEEANQDADLMARAKFAGIYESQVRARILRAWRLPDEPAPEPDFSCLAQIHQRRDGRVIEVELVLAQCDGSPAWQQSLVNAIQVASPLPAPPHPSVFVDVFSLVFHSSAVGTAGRVARR